ncbi:GNAT family N-acetyltransferase [Flavobacteriales bacterium 33_180_T64]|nr:GNAT family N-acetyltransferase [Flavobacteriales bacterium 33_180_T64]
MIVISTDKSRLDITIIHEFLTESYWAKGRTIDQVKTSIEHCFCFGVYLENKQIGFARIVTDYVVFAYVMDVFILPEYRGEGYAKQLMITVHEASELRSCTVWMLKTSDAHKLYHQFGYTTLKQSEKVMERLLK